MRRAPTWPLMLRRDLAAVACDLTLAQFERAVLEGSMPQPVKVAGVELWPLKSIEAALGRLTGEDEGNWRDRQRALNRAA